MSRQPKRLKLSESAETSDEPNLAWRIISRPTVTASKKSINEVIVSLQRWMGSDDDSSPDSSVPVDDFWNAKSEGPNSSTTEISPRTVSLLHLLHNAPVGLIRAASGPRRTLADLPVELLAQILSYAPAEAFSVSRVCKHLRQVVMSMPQLWTYVSNYQTPNEVTLALARSGEEKLTVALFSINGDNSKCRSFLRLVLPHRKRWKEFRFVADEYRAELFSELWKTQNVKGACPRFPSLESLHLQCYHPDYNQDEESCSREIYHFELHFWGRWEMPNLRRFYFSSVEDGLNAFETPPTLRCENLASLKIDYHKDRRGVEGILKCMEFIGRFQHLCDLELTIYELRIEEFLELPPQMFPNLGSLRLNYTSDAFQSAEQAVSVFEELMQFLVTPRLTQLILQVNNKKTINIKTWLRRINYDKISILYKLYLQFRHPTFGVLLLFSRKDVGLSANFTSAFLDEVRDKALFELLKLELAGMPNCTNFNLVDHLEDDRTAREYMKQFYWFRY